MSRRATTAVGTLLSAMVLASGSAAAQPAPGDAGVAATSDVVLNEIGVDLNTFALRGTFVELHNPDSNNPVSLSGYSLVGCDGTSSFTLVDFSASNEIAAGGFYLIAGPDFDGSSGEPDQEFENDQLVQDDGGVALANLGTPVDGVKWGNPQSFDCASLTDAGVTPDDDHSIQSNPNPPPAWCRAIPTPRSTNGSCAL